MKRLYFFLLLLALVVVSAASQKPVVVESQSNGRFQIVISANERADTFLLDTHTGQIWQKVTYIDLPSNPEVWQFQSRVDNVEQLRAWIEHRKAMFTNRQ